VADVEAVTEVRVHKLTIAADVGMIVNPDGVANQIEGGAIQATSWTLKEQVRFDRTRLTSGSWETYPILRFSEVPEVEIALIDRPEQPPLGAGEIAQGQVAGAIANALFDATGLRVRDLPLTPERVAAAAGR
jgi:CO/xanthine dehydrogenase Mo-binding subunit